MPGFTRSLTVLYSTTLLSLLGVIQLSILARSKYLKALTQMAREEQMRETLEGQLLMSNLLFGGAFSVQDLLSETLNSKDDDAVSEFVEAKFLTMSWWILHVGWKDIAERVRKGVEEVFEGYVFNRYLEPI